MHWWMTPHSLTLIFCPGTRQVCNNFAINRSSCIKHSLYIRLILDFAEEFVPVPQGEFMSRAHPTQAPFSPPPLPGVSETNQMTYCWSSECMANTSDDVYQKAGTFKHTLTGECQGGSQWCLLQRGVVLCRACCMIVCTV